MNVSYIAPSNNLLPKRLRVAAYARVSSGKDASLHSLSAQVAYYSSLIQRNSEWEYAGVYADEASTGTKESRPEFQHMLTDCKNGKIDLVLTKSISRFARNTITTINTVRTLREYGVDVWFERENLHTNGADGEFMLTILSSFAQEESFSASENQKWKIRKNFEEGIPTVNPMIGYRQCKDEFTIVPEEAAVVRQIFDAYLSGMGANAIVKMLIDQGVPSKRNASWYESAIMKILQNEKYVGDLLLQKSYRADHITKKTVKNNGALPQYYVQENHEAIIDRETFQKVQAEIARRTRKCKCSPPTITVYSGKIICEQCGKHFRRKTTANGKVVWICSTYNRLGKAYCNAKQIPEIILNTLVDGIEFREIRIPNANTVKIITVDGDETTKTWENPSRSESWTPEMREQAKERSLWQKKQSQ